MISESSPNATSTSTDLGLRGEALAAAYLEQLGFRLVAANFVVPVGRNRKKAIVNAELDLIAYEGPLLCFIEVKTRASDWFAPPAANVDLRKQRQITKAAQAYRRIFGVADEPYRFDVVSVVLPATAAPAAAGPLTGFQIDLLRNFWQEEKFRKRWPSSIPWD